MKCVKSCGAALIVREEHASAHARIGEGKVKDIHCKFYLLSSIASGRGEPQFQHILSFISVSYLRLKLYISRFNWLLENIPRSFFSFSYLIKLVLFGVEHIQKTDGQKYKEKAGSAKCLKKDIKRQANLE